MIAGGKIPRDLRPKARRIHERRCSRLALDLATTPGRLVRTILALAEQLVLGRVRDRNHGRMTQATFD